MNFVTVAGMIGNATATKIGLMPTDAFHICRALPSVDSVNDIILSGLYRINGKKLGTPEDYGLLIVFNYKDNIYQTTVQIFIVANTNKTWLRHKWSDTQSWSSWNSLSE